MQIKKVIYVLSGILLPVVSAFATEGLPPVETTTPGNSYSTTSGVDNGYGGLKWTFDGGIAPEIIVGYRHAEVTSNGYAQGADISFAFKVFDGLQPGKLRIKYFDGSDYMQGEVGGGYDFGKGGFFAGIGGNAPFSNLGVDYNFSQPSPLEPYFMLDSLGQYTKPHANTTPSKTTVSCPSGTQLTGNFCTPLQLF